MMVGTLRVTNGCTKFCEEGLDQDQRRKIAEKISEFFGRSGFPRHDRLDSELADFLAGELRAIICPGISQETETS